MQDEHTTDRDEKYANIVAKLPCLNSVLTRLLALDEDDLHYFNEVLELANEDPSFAVRIIKIANASHHAPVKPITNLHQAITRIGLKNITGLITTYSLADTFACKTKSDRDLWIHSVMVAIAAKKLSHYVHDFELEEHEAYLAGLIHDIGRFVLFAHAPDALSLTDELEWRDPDSLLVAEQKVCGMDHASLGAFTCQAWHLPDFFVGVVSKHHDYGFQANTQSEKRLASLLRLLHVCDALSMFLMHNQTWRELDEESLFSAIDEKSKHPSWDSRPVETLHIINNIETILADTAEMLEDLNEMSISIQNDYATLFFVDFEEQNPE